jgi:anti-sigma B factor antagonist
LSLAIQSRRVGFITVIDCAGKLIAGDNVDYLNDQVRRCIDSHSSVVVNLGAVTFIDSSGLGLLVRLVTTTRNSAAGLRFCGANDQIKKVLELTKLRDILNVYATEQQAIEAFGKKEIGQVGGRGGTSVLCLDPSMDLLAFLRGALDKAGFQSHSARNLPDALLLLRTLRPGAVVAGPEFAPKVAGIAAEMNIPLICFDQDLLAMDAGDATASLLQQLNARLAKGNA